MTRFINPVRAGDIVVSCRESFYTTLDGLTVPTRTYTLLRVTRASLTGKATHVTNGIRARAIAPSSEQVFTLPAVDTDAARRLVGQSFGSKQEIREALDNLINWSVSRSAASRKSAKHSTTSSTPNGTHRRTRTMTTMNGITRKIKKGDRVVVTRGGDIGIVGTVDRLSTSTTRKYAGNPAVKRRWVHLQDCHLEGPLDGDPVPHAACMVEVEEVYLRDVVTTDEYRALRVQRREMIAEQDRKLAEYEATRREETLAAYIAKRGEPVGRIAYREDRDETTNAVRRIYFDPFSMTRTDEGLPKMERDRITIDNRDAWDARYSPEVTVNWSALGAVTPDEAFAFAQALFDAALRARVLRAENEKEFGITERVRAALDAR